MKLASEKNLNKNVFPVIRMKGKPVKYPFGRRHGPSGFACYKGTLRAKELMILDIIGTATIHQTYNNTFGQGIEYGHRIPTQNETKVKQISSLHTSYRTLTFLIKEILRYGDRQIPEHYCHEGGLPREICANDQRIKNPLTLKLTDRHLKKQLPFLKRYSSKQICEMIQRTSECELALNYPIRFFDGKKYQNFPFNNFKIRCTFFTLVDVKKTSMSRHGHVLEREYEIRFDSLLGYFFVQNSVSCYTDLVPGKFYLMSEYAQLFYRLLILPFYGNAKNPLSLAEIKHRLVLKADNYMVRKTVKRILDELEANSLIKEPKELKNTGRYMFSYEKMAWKDIVK